MVAAGAGTRTGMADKFRVHFEGGPIDGMTLPLYDEVPPRLHHLLLQRPDTPPQEVEVCDYERTGDPSGGDVAYRYVRADDVVDEGTPPTR